MKELIGKKIENIYINDNQSLLIFKTNEGLIAYATEAECCSDTWFADMIDIDNLIEEIVLSVENLNYPDPCDGRSRQDFDTVYAHKLITEKGPCEIIYRNSSNGYYGGDIILYNEDINNEKLRDLIEIKGNNWRA